MKLYFQDFPIFSILTIIIWFAWKRLAETLMSPFNGDYFFALKMDREMNVQILKASLALYQGEPTTTTSLPQREESKTLPQREESKILPQREESNEDESIV